MKETRVLIVGNAYSIHVIWFTKALKKYYPNIKVDFFHDGCEIEGESFNCIFDNVFCGDKRFPSILYGIPKVRGILELKDNSASFLNFANKGLHYKTAIFLRVPRWTENAIKRIHSVCDKVIVYPFGSEVLRCGRRFFNYINNYPLKYFYCIH